MKTKLNDDAQLTQKTRKKAEKVAAIFDAALQRLRDFDADIAKEMGFRLQDRFGGSVDDCFITIFGTGKLRGGKHATAKVLLAYDGAGYDHLSYQADTFGGGELPTRKRIYDDLAKIGLHFEDENNWSLAVWIN